MSNTKEEGGGQGSDQHKNDLYGSNISARSESDARVAPSIPAATVVLLRDGPQGDVEVLMLRKNSKITFGGMWVFPGGKIDPTDYPTNGDVDTAAQNAAVRESEEEAGLRLTGDDFVQFAHWTPPPGPQKRFATWFFAAAAPSDVEISIDDGEIKDSDWLRPKDALDRHAAGDIDLAPPTWVTLYHIARYSPTAAVLAHFEKQTVKIYKTRVDKSAEGHRVAMWAGDAGYEDWQADVAGARHRLVMAEAGFVFQNTVEAY